LGLIALVSLPSPVSAAPEGSYYEFTNKAARGEGGALIWPLYTVTNTNTLLAITNSSIVVNGSDSLAGACTGAGCPGLSGGAATPSTKGGFSVSSPGRWTLVHFHVRKDTDSTDLKDWKVCLSPGDVWTATFVASGANTTIDTSDLSTVTGTVFPATATGTKGYIEAVAVDTGTTQANGCDGIPNSNTWEGSAEANILATHSLFGEAFFVTGGTGLASGYNATALDSFQDFRDLLIANSIKNTGFPQGAPPSSGGTPNTAQKRTFFALAFGSGGNTVGMLQSRWLVDSSLGMDTQMVVTFPVGNVSLRPNWDFGFTGADICADCQLFNFNIPSAMALFLRDDEELRSGGSPVQVPMGNEVNVITLSTLLTANPGLRPTPTTTAGWLNFMIDADENEFVDSVQGKTCVGATPSPAQACADAAGTLTSHFVPAALPVVGFTILQATTPTSLMSALLPWKTASPDSQYQCDAASGDHGRCSGVGIDID